MSIQEKQILPEETEKELSIYKAYQEVILPLTIKLEIQDVKYPIEIFNEIRSIFTHLCRYKIQRSSKEIFCVFD